MQVVPLSLSARRAWIEIGIIHACLAQPVKSLSARRAWIEIISPPSDALRSWVALRKESVDRNPENGSFDTSVARSLSARRAWIEISMSYNAVKFWVWSLSARRAWIEIMGMIWRFRMVLCRSPQGERG